MYQQRNQTYQTALAPSISHHTYCADQQPARQWGKEHSTNCATPGFNGCLEHHRIYLDRYEDTVGTFRHFNGGDRLYRTRAYVGDYAVFTRGRYGELEMSLLLRDRLGSVVGVESARLIGGRINAIVSESRHGFDAFGAPRANRERPGSSWQGRDPWQTPSRTQQGFTGHERLSGLQLIHMKGRVFDPLLGRFHGVDPIIQFPLSSQGLNPYSYILNNPMAGVDPTGYASVRESCNRRQSCEMRYSALATLAGDLKSDVAGMSTMGGTLGDTFRVLSSTANNGARGSLAAKFEKFEGAVEIGELSQVGKNEGGEFGDKPMSSAFGRMANPGLEKQEGVNSNMSDRQVNMLAKQVRGNLQSGREVAKSALEAYCLAQGGCEAGDTPQDFEAVRFRFDRKLFFGGQTHASEGLTGGYVDRSTSPPSIVLYAGGIAFQGNGTQPKAVAEILLHEFRHLSPHGTALFNEYLKSGESLPYLQRPHEVDAFNYAREVLKYVD